PDIVKTDGTHLFVSSEAQYFYNFENIVPLKEEIKPSAGSGSSGTAPSDGVVTEPSPAPDTVSGSPAIIRPEPIQSSTNSIQAFPPESLSTLATVPESGNVLLNNNVLVIFAAQKIVGYD